MPAVVIRYLYFRTIEVVGAAAVLEFQAIPHLADHRLPAGAFSTNTPTNGKARLRKPGLWKAAVYIRPQPYRVGI
jgi:hypothetical protein